MQIPKICCSVQIFILFSTSAKFVTTEFPNLVHENHRVFVKILKICHKASKCLVIIPKYGMVHADPKIC